MDWFDIHRQALSGGMISMLNGVPVCETADGRLVMVNQGDLMESPKAEFEAHRREISGLSEREERAILDIRDKLLDARADIEALGRHRHYSVAITHLETSMLWLLDRIEAPKG